MHNKITKPILSFQLKKGLIDTPNSALCFQQIPFGTAATDIPTPREDCGIKFCYGSLSIRAGTIALAAPTQFRRRSDLQMRPAGGSMQT